MPSQRPFTPCGTYKDKKAAEAACREKPAGQEWVPCKVKDGFAIVRKV